MQTYTRRAVLGAGITTAGSLFVPVGATATSSQDFVLDHAGREMVRLHNRGQMRRATTLALTSANLRLLAGHPAAMSVQMSVQGIEVEDLYSDRPFERLHWSLRSRHGYTGTVQDLRNLTLDAPPSIASSVLEDFKAGRTPLSLAAAAERLDKLSLRFDISGLNNPARSKGQMFQPLLRQVFDPGEGVEPCVVLATIQFGLMFIGIVFTMGGAGVVVGGIIAGMGLVIQMIRYGAC